MIETGRNLEGIFVSPLQREVTVGGKFELLMTLHKATTQL